jgi:pyruvate-ferredoxin/flavodoxin oxidoreductase
LFHYDPRRLEQGLSALSLDSGAPKGGLDRFTRNEARFRMVEQQHPEAFKGMMAASEVENARRFATYEQLSRMAAASPAVPAIPAKS